MLKSEKIQINLKKCNQFANPNRFNRLFIAFIIITSILRCLSIRNPLIMSKKFFSNSLIFGLI